MGQPKLTAIVQSRCLTLFGYIAHMDDNTDAKRILSTLPPEDWRRPRGCPRITWLSTIQQDLRSHNLTLPEAVDMAQNRSLWKMWSTYGAMQSWVACQKRRHPNMLYLVVTLLLHITMKEKDDDYTWYETVRREMVWCQMLNQVNLMSSSMHSRRCYCESTGSCHTVCCSLRCLLPLPSRFCFHRHSFIC